MSPDLARSVAAAAIAEAAEAERTAGGEVEGAMEVGLELVPG